MAAEGGVSFEDEITLAEFDPDGDVYVSSSASKSDTFHVYQDCTKHPGGLLDSKDPNVLFQDHTMCDHCRYRLETGS